VIETQTELKTRTLTVCVSMDLNDKKFLETRGLSASKVLRTAIGKLKAGAEMFDDADREAFLQKIEKLQNLFAFTRDYIAQQGILEDFEKALARRPK